MSDDQQVVDAEVVEERGHDVDLPDPPLRSPSHPPAVSEGQELVVRDDPDRSLFKTDDPVEVLEQAGRVADALKGALQRQGMIQRIQGREHVKVEGWQTVGAMLGLSSRVVWARKLEEGDGWEAKVEVVNGNGVVIASGESMCTRSESMWKSRDEYALRAMAQTRATSRAFRGVLGFVVTMAGYEATPSDEMPGGEPAPPPAASDQLNATLNKALEWAMETETLPNPDAVRQQMITQGGGYLQAPMAQGALFVLSNIKRAYEASIPPEMTPPEDEE